MIKSTSDNALNFQVFRSSISVKYVGKVDKGGSQLTGVIFDCQGILSVTKDYSQLTGNTLGCQGLFSIARDYSRFLKIIPGCDKPWYRYNKFLPR